MMLPLVGYAEKETGSRKERINKLVEMYQTPRL